MDTESVYVIVQNEKQLVINIWFTYIALAATCHLDNL